MKVRNFIIVFLGLTICSFGLANSSLSQEKASFQGTINKKVDLRFTQGKFSGVLITLDNQSKKIFIIPSQDFEKYKLNIPTNFIGQETFDAAEKELAGKKVSLECLKTSESFLPKDKEVYEVTHMKW